MGKSANFLAKFKPRRCFYCGNDYNLTRDHKIPKSRGGTETYTNLVPACRSCNNEEKADMTLEEFRMSKAIQHFKALDGMLPFTGLLSFVKSMQEIKFFGELQKEQQKSLYWRD